MTKSKIVQVIVGPTASGKSAYAVGMATDHNGVIINCDAMQSYDALHVLTAQPTAEEQAEAPHRLYGHLHPSTHYSAADWRRDAIQAIEQAWEQEQMPILCGGTGFYLKALMEGLSPIPEIPDEVRASASALMDDVGIEKFHTLLQEKDPKTAAQIDPMNPQRNIRAWEVFDHTGRSLADWQNEPMEGAPDGWNFHVTAIVPNRDKQIQNIHKRLEVMVDQGILDEVRALDSLIQSGMVPEDALIIKAHGFRPFRRYLNGEWGLDEAIEQTAIETRQYAKRQMTWIRNQLQVDQMIENG